MTLITSEKRKLQKMWKLEKTNKKKQLKAKSKGGKTVKERHIDSKILITETIRTLIAKKMVKIHQDILGEECESNDNGVLASRDEDQKTTWKFYHEKLLNTVFKGDKNSLEQIQWQSVVCFA